jgi:hypothetical protein
VVTTQAHIPRQTTQTGGVGDAIEWAVPNTVAGLDAELTPYIPSDANVAVSYIELLSQQVMRIEQNIVLAPLELTQAVIVSPAVPEMRATIGECIGLPTKPSNADVERLRDWLLSDSLDWDAVERARHEAW